MKLLSTRVETVQDVRKRGIPLSTRYSYTLGDGNISRAYRTGFSSQTFNLGCNQNKLLITIHDIQPILYLEIRLQPIRTLRIKLPH